MSREIFFNGVFEPVEVSILQNVLRPGMRFVDVGANRGYFSILAAVAVGPTGRVLALEPDPRLYDVLVQALAQSRLSQVTALPIAAAARSASVNLLGFEEGGGNFGVSRISDSASGDATIFTVAARALDDVLDEYELPEIDLLKMDIEGYEGFALSGLTRALTEKRVHRLLIEFHPSDLASHGHETRTLVEQLADSGYMGWQIDHSAQAYRAAAYGRRVLQDFVRPLFPSDDLGRWPHTFWVRRDLGWSPTHRLAAGRVAHCRSWA
jgi:FkbM family methyltransferase